MTLRELLGLSLDNVERKRYNANAIGKQISVVKIDGVEISGFKAFSFVRKLSYTTEPKRAGDGSLGNIDSIPVILTPQLQIDFSLLFIDSYRKIMNLIYARREHFVECYDVVRDVRVQEKMYFEPEELPKLVAIAREFQGDEDSVIELLGVQDYTVVLTGTNNPTEQITTIYLDKEDNILSAESGAENSEFLVGANVVVPDYNGYAFNNLWERVGGAEYLNNEAYRLTLDNETEKDTRQIVFKAIYKSTQQFSLVLSYGLGTAIKDINGKDINSLKFVVGDTIGETIAKNNIFLFEGGILARLPYGEPITTTINDIKYTTYNWLGWYETSQKGENQTPLSENSILQVNGDMIIYSLHAPVKHSVVFVGNNSISYAPLENVEYGSSVPLPTPYKENYTFGGWYTDELLENKFDGKMPPYDLTLYAKWEENK